MSRGCSLARPFPFSRTSWEIRDENERRKEKTMILILSSTASWIASDGQCRAGCRRFLRCQFCVMSGTPSKEMQGGHANAHFRDAGIMIPFLGIQ